MADEGDILNRLKPNYPDHLSPFLPAEEGHLGYLPRKLSQGHVGLLVAVGWDDPLVGFGCLVDNKIYSLGIAGLTDAYHN